MKRKLVLHRRTLWNGVVLSLACGMLSGCALTAKDTSAPTAVAGVAFTGSVHGGQQPVSGARIQLYAAGNTGYGSAYSYTSGSSLIGTTTVLSDSGGNFSITGDYTCPAASTPVYIVATGGNPGLSQANTSIALMTALGPCGNLTASTNISINELTTVASVWALSPFMTGIGNVGTSSTNTSGLLNAFAAVKKVVDPASGFVAGPALPPGASLPVSKINTLANILASCVNSSGGSSGDGSACGTLFSNSTVAGSAAPADTITAALNIAQHPNANVAALTGLSTPNAPFQPTLSRAPNDFSLVISYSAGGFSAPRAIAVDPAANVWVTNSGSNTVTEMDNSGAVLSGSTGYAVGSMNVPSAIAIDPAGNAWIANTGNSTVTELTSAGTSANIFSGGSMSAPSSIAIDGFNNVWITNSGNSSLTRINQAGTLINYTGTGISSPIAITINPK